MGTRFDAPVDETITLKFQFLRDNLELAAYQIQKVEIYPTQADALANTNIIETIAQGDVSDVGTGLYQYVATAISTAGNYFDKIYVIPVIGDTPLEFTQPFYIRKISSGPQQPDNLEVAEIGLNLFDFLAAPARDTMVKVRLNKAEVWYNNEKIIDKTQTFEPDSDGIVTMTLVETGTMGADVHYIFDIGGVLKEKKVIPKGTLASDYKDLSAPS